MQQGNHIRQGANGRVQNNWKVSSDNVIKLCKFRFSLGDCISRNACHVKVPKTAVLIIKVKPSCLLPYSNDTPTIFSRDLLTISMPLF